MKTWVRLIPASLLLGCGAVFASGSGTLYQQGEATVLKNAYAFRLADPFEAGKQITRVVFADQPIDAATLDDSSDRDSAIDDMLRHATRVELNIEADGSVQNLNLKTLSGSGSQSGSGWYTLDLKHNDDKRIEGTFRSNDETEKQSGRYYDLAFALDLPGAPNLGTPLPAGGGEQGKVYLSHLAMLKKGDIDGLAKTMSKQRAEQLLAHRGDADFKMMFGFIQSRALRDPKYVKGHVKGDAATLEYTGKDEEGNVVTTTVSMKREAGAWKIEKEASSTTLN